jgi:hypothetical protein
MCNFGHIQFSFSHSIEVESVQELVVLGEIAESISREAWTDDRWLKMNQAVD